MNQSGVSNQTIENDSHKNIPNQETNNSPQFNNTTNNNTNVDTMQQEHQDQPEESQKTSEKAHEKLSHDMFDTEAWTTLIHEAQFKDINVARPIYEVTIQT
jgi:recombination DNA repair RAD52 pathway protein